MWSFKDAYLNEPVDIFKATELYINKSYVMVTFFLSLSLK